MSAALTFKKFYGATDPAGDQTFASKLRDRAVVLRNADRVDAALPWEEMPDEHKAFVLLLRLPRRFKDMENNAGIPSDKALPILRGLHAAEVLDALDVEQAKALIPVEVRKALAELKGTQVVRKKLFAAIYRPAVEGTSQGSNHPSESGGGSSPQGNGAPAPPPPTPPPFRPSPPQSSPVPAPPPPRQQPVVRPAPPPARAPSSAGLKAVETLEFKQIQKEVEEAHAKLAKGLNHFDVLGLERAATDEKVKAAYLGLVRKWHPDRLSGFQDPMLEDTRTKMGKLFAAVGEANKVLGDSASRKTYLEDLTRREAAGATSAQAAAKPVRADEAKLHATKGRVFAQKKDYAAAEVEYKRAHEFDGGLPEYKTEWAWAIALNASRPEKDRRDKALSMLLEVVGSSRHAEAHYKMGLIHRMNGDIPKAEAAFKKAFQVDKTHEEAAREVRLMETRAKSAKEEAKGGGLLDMFKKK